MGVPVISVNLDTFTTIERIESILGKTHLKGETKLKRAAAVVKRGVDFTSLYKALGLKG